MVLFVCSCECVLFCSDLSDSVLFVVSCFVCVNGSAHVILCYVLSNSVLSIVFCFVYGAVFRLFMVLYFVCGAVFCLWCSMVLCAVCIGTSVS